MTGRVQAHPPPLAAGLGVGLDRTEPQCELLRRVEVLVAEVQVDRCGTS